MIFPSLYPLIRSALFTLDPEAAHHATISALKYAPLSLLSHCSPPYKGEPIRLMGLSFPNPIGLAAGFDKNAECIDALTTLGFGFVEVGTVTPKSQPGNPKPRMFRLTEARGVINRLGFNNDGLDTFLHNVGQSRRSNGLSRHPLGLNIGKNAKTPIENAADDYLTCLAGVYPHADYVTINISSPNTQGLRQLQNAEALDHLLERLMSKRENLAVEHRKRVPIVLKIAPDLEPEDLDAIAGALTRHGLDGLIATNTTISREAVTGHFYSNEAGGLSGAPVFEKSNQVLAGMRARLGTNFPIIGVGGILSGEDAVKKKKAGADLVQIYTGLIYRGPALIQECLDHWQ